jgi:L-arabinose isomerase
MTKSTPFRELQGLFEISEDSDVDRLAKKPTDEEMRWACRVAAGMDRVVADFDRITPTMSREI